MVNKILQIENQKDKGRGNKYVAHKISILSLLSNKLGYEILGIQDKQMEL